MSTTPAKSPERLHSFIPKETTTPNKNTPGISKTVFTHISDLHSLLSDWIRLRDKGTRICKSMSALKLHEFTDGYYPQALTPLSETIMDVLEDLMRNVEGVEKIDKHLQALSKLQPCNQPVIFTWSAKQISDNVSKICQSLQKELKLKLVITENIAHCRDEYLMEVYASAWEFEAYFDIESSSYLFAEVGITGIS
ncbi:cyclin-dependent kinase 2-interacting protein-like [Hyposmocoma kahamanoa]|uniref:cyclin-dependent kinase 2-interacting protein-like n=1 Tax=Hyposmocoma kahamanoa TaxID=1477025 RepID=UPI000E6D8F32|nr:cyclin-dependent kinase 2-interacting protein-like [Hyposmocoma kahamanoa]